METKNLTDRELLISIFGKVDRIEDDIKILKIDVSGLKKDFSEMKEKQNDMHDTLYGNKSREIIGLVVKFKDMAASMSKYKKWEFGIGLVIGFTGFIFTAIFGVKEIYNLFVK